MNDKQILRDLGKIFKEERQKAGLTQANLAARIDKDQQSIQRFEKGRINPTIIYLLEVSAGIGIELSLLIKTFEEVGSSNS